MTKLNRETRKKNFALSAIQDSCNYRPEGTLAFGFYINDGPLFFSFFTVYKEVCWGIYGSYIILLCWGHCPSIVGPSHHIESPC